MDYIFVIQISIGVVILNLHILFSQLVENGAKIVSNRGILNIHFKAEMFYCFHEYVQSDNCTTKARLHWKKNKARVYKTRAISRGHCATVQMS